MEPMGIRGAHRELVVDMVDLEVLPRAWKILSRRWHLIFCMLCSHTASSRLAYR